MRTLTIRNRFHGNSTVVENEFIDLYMPKANGEYVKVYLLLLRHLNLPDVALSISMLADRLECTEKDIVRALNYWSETGLLKIDYDTDGSICGLAIGKGAVDAPVMEKTPAPVSAPRTPAASQEDLRQLYFIAEQYIGKPLSANELKKINYFFDTLHFSVDLIEYLIEYCVENGHKSMHYIESVALNWSDANITTVDQAKEASASYHKNCYAVLNAFGIRGRNPAKLELDYIKKWTDEYGFTLDIILEACNRTIANTAKPDFKYADTILTSWLSKNVHHLSDVSRLDLAHQQAKASRKRVAVKSATPPNRFHNFEKRTYDIHSLEQQLLNTN